MILNIQLFFVAECFGQFLNHDELSKNQGKILSAPLGLISWRKYRKPLLA